MSLDTQQFGIKRYWLSAAFEHLPGRPDIFAAKSLNEARKAFLAGNNQVKAIKNWLNCADVIESTKGSKVDRVWRVDGCPGSTGPESLDLVALPFAPVH